MDALKIASFAVCAAGIALLLRRMRPEAAVALVIAAGIMTALMALPMLQDVIKSLCTLASAYGVGEAYLSQLLKVGGVSLLMDFAAQSCRDAGEEGLALKTEIAGRIILISLALPVMQKLLDQIMSLLP